MNNIIHKIRNKTEQLKEIKLDRRLVAVFCLFLYPPTFKTLPVISTALVYGISAFYLLLNRTLVGDIIQKQYKLFLFSLALFVLSLLVPAVSQTGDFSYLSATTYFFRKGFVFIFLLCTTINRHNKEGALQYFLYYYALAHAIYVIGTLVLVLIPSIQNTWFSIFKMESEEVYFRTANYTFRLGWQGFAGFRLTLHCTFSVIILLYLKYASPRIRINTKQFVIPYFLCILGNMFYGRIGLIVTIIVSTIAIVFWNRKHLWKISAYLGTIVAVVLLLGALKEIPFLQSWYNWMSRPITNLVQTGNFGDSSFDRLQEMNQVEISPSTLIHGDGKFREDGHYYMQTDAGFVRNILFWGIIGGMLSYGVTLYSIFETKKVHPLLMTQLLITFLAFEYKGDVYYEFITISFALNYARQLSEGVKHD